MNRSYSPHTSSGGSFQSSQSERCQTLLLTIFLHFSVPLLDCGIRDPRNLVYAWTLEVWVRKGRMGAPKHSSEKEQGDFLTPFPTIVFLGSYPPFSLSNLQRSGINWISLVPHYLVTLFCNYSLLSNCNALECLGRSIVETLNSYAWNFSCLSRHMWCQADVKCFRKMEITVYFWSDPEAAAATLARASNQMMFRQVFLFKWSGHSAKAQSTSLLVHTSSTLEQR